MPVPLDKFILNTLTAQNVTGPVRGGRVGGFGLTLRRLGLHGWGAKLVGWAEGAGLGVGGCMEVLGALQGAGYPGGLVPRVLGT